MRRGWKWLAAAAAAVLLGSAAAAPREPAVTLAALGDVMLARTVPERVERHSPAWLWSAIAPELAAADLRFANLECPVATSGSPVPKPVCFRAAPAFVRAALAAGGLDLLSLANNHTFDYGAVAARETLSHLSEWGIASAGLATGRAAAVQPTIVARGGLRIGLLAYTDWTPESYRPAPDDVSLATVQDDTLSDEVAAAKAQVDCLLVSVHWGNEYVPYPSDRQKALAHTMIDAGADVVLGHHPHVWQGSAEYRGKPILYSLGNAVFDRSGRRWSNGGLAVLRLRKDAASLERVVRLEPVDSRPTVVDPDPA